MAKEAPKHQPKKVAKKPVVIQLYEEEEDLTEEPKEPSPEVEA